MPNPRHQNAKTETPLRTWHGALVLAVWSALVCAIPTLSAELFAPGAVPQFSLPPRFIEISPPQSWQLVVSGALCILVLLAPIVWRALDLRTPYAKRQILRPSFTLVGAGCALLVSWALSWTRLAVTEPLQLHTFTPLWLCYIAFTNLLIRDLGESAPLFCSPRTYLKLFPASALLWWVFEYLNRFVQNWSYENISHFSPFQYFCFATLSFSTVLPAIAATQKLLAVHSIFSRFRFWVPVHIPAPSSMILALVAIVGLCGIAIFPLELFALVWIAPLLLLFGLCMAGRPARITEDVSRGDWRLLITYALAGLVCGVLWEMWNFLSLARWQYTIPYVGLGKIFEMPILGYAGYLPFGVLCGLVIDLITPRAAPKVSPCTDIRHEHFPILL